MHSHSHALSLSLSLLQFLINEFAEYFTHHQNFDAQSWNILGFNPPIILKQKRKDNFSDFLFHADDKQLAFD